MKSFLSSVQQCFLFPHEPQKNAREHFACARENKTQNVPVNRQKSAREHFHKKMPVNLKSAREQFQ